MFCYQCEQTSKGEGCQVIGVCGKDESSAELQDLLIHVVKGIAQYAHRARRFGAIEVELDVFVLNAIFSTLTNVNFDPLRLETLIREAADRKQQARELYEAAARKAAVVPEKLTGPALWEPAPSYEGLLEQAKLQLLPLRFLAEGQEVSNLIELVTYGIKGVAAYAAHAWQLGGADLEANGTVYEVLDALTQPQTTEQLLGLAMKVGELNYKIMALLDRVHTETFGHPTPTTVRIHPRAGKAILISGHDLADLHALLQQTQGLGINVYTHGEMLPAHGYPALKAFKHLAGNFGGAWQDQCEEFAEFPGAILMSSNCIQQPKDSYKGRIFTAGQVMWPGVKHVSRKDFGAVIAAALSAPGFAEDGADNEITVGFGHNAVLSVADQVIDAVKAGAIRHFFLIGGCDGARSGRGYYTELAEKVPDDCIIMTLACGKYRFNKLDFGTIGGLPRLLDIGQCNDTYSALQIALALAKAFECEVNDLPLSLVLSWYEQKAVAILLTLLWLGVKNVRIGPSLPAFLSPGVLALLHENYNLMAITTPEADLAAILGK